MTVYLVLGAILAIFVFFKARVRVPAGSVYVVERLGRYHRTLEPGTHFVAPVLDAVRFRHSLDGVSPITHSVTARSRDQRGVTIEFNARVRVANAEKASYAVHDPAEYLRELIRIQVERDVNGRTWDELRESRRQIEGNVLGVARGAAATTGIELTDFRITRLDVSG
jgi:regulator of protease activity HflC (stomatin/prohibitin superfamily)